MINLCCAFGGRSAEYEVSLESAYSVITNVDLQKYNVIKLGVTRNGRWYVYEGENEKIKAVSYTHLRPPGAGPLQESAQLEGSRGWRSNSPS